MRRRYASQIEIQMQFESQMSTWRLQIQMKLETQKSRYWSRLEIQRLLEIQMSRYCLLENQRQIAIHCQFELDK